jgi:hypothetical protein
MIAHQFRYLCIYVPPYLSLYKSTYLHNYKFFKILFLVLLILEIFRFADIYCCQWTFCTPPQKVHQILYIDKWTFCTPPPQKVHQIYILINGNFAPPPPPKVHQLYILTLTNIFTIPPKCPFNFKKYSDFKIHIFVHLHT